jgi:nucleoside-diphosphate-sugar epimerase
MRIFLTGATGAIGKRLVPLLVSRGHHVVATTRSRAKLDGLRSAGTEPVFLDALDSEGVMEAVLSSRPDVVVHQATALAEVRSFRNFDAEFALTNRLRTEGTGNVLKAAEAAGVRRVVAQSYTGWPNVRDAGRVKTEDDPLDPNPPRTMVRTLDAIRRLEDMVTRAQEITGIVLRYGSFYGPGTSIAPDGYVVEMVQHRRFPIFGDGSGVWSFVHIDDAARATVLAAEGKATGIYNIVDDEPAEVSVWLPELARDLGARPPLRLPAWIGRMVLGEAGMSMMNAVRGSSNGKAKRVLGWHPNDASWRQGFRRELASKPAGIRPQQSTMTEPRGLL